MTPFANPIQEYHYKIQHGEIIVGKWIKLLYDKIVAGLRDGLFYYDARKSNRAIEFIETFCRHCEGRDDYITLELWQKATVCLIFGIVDDEGLRVFREVFLVMGRKNGKSLFASACIAYTVYLDGEYGAKNLCTGVLCKVGGSGLKEIIELRNIILHLPCKLLGLPLTP